MIHTETPKEMSLNEVDLIGNVVISVCTICEWAHGSGDESGEATRGGSDPIG